jgi:hypothetical protein
MAMKRFLAGAGAAVIVCLAVLGFLRMPRETADSEPGITRDTADVDQVTHTTSDQAVGKDSAAEPNAAEPSPISETRESDPAEVRTPPVYERPPTWFETNIGRNFEDCKKKRLALDVCKHWFELRDQQWASATEQRIEDLLSSMTQVRLTTADHPASPPVECRVTFCRVTLDVQDGPTNVTLAWAHDRGEELRLGLAMSDLITNDAEVDVILGRLGVRERDPLFLQLYAHRCPKSYESCGAN